MTTSAAFSVYALDMETVYLDSLFALNLVINYLLLLCSGRVAGICLHRWRYALAATIGALYAVGSVLPGWGFLGSMPMKLALGALMSLIAYGGEARLIRCTAIFYCVSAAFGGAVWGASMLAGGGLTAYGYTPVSLRVLVLSFALCYAAVTLFLRRTGTRPERVTARLTISFRGRSVEVPALVDTGNRLYDPATGRRVAVVTARALAPLFPDGGRALQASSAAERLRLLSELPGCRGRLTLLPYSSLGASFGLLLALRPDEALIDGEKRPLLIGIYEGTLTEDDTLCAIV